MNNLISNICFTFGNQKTKEGKSISAETSSDAIQAILTEVASKFGGYTITRGHGGWYDTKREVLVVETAVIVNIAVIGIDQHGIHDTINGIASVIKSALDQDCVLVQLSYGTSELI